MAVNYVGDSLISISSQYAIPAGSQLEIIYNSAITAEDIGTSPILFAALNGVRVSNVSYAISLNTITVTNMFRTQFASGLV